MEPANLNSPDDAQIEALLRPTAPILPDGGFSTRVLAALPPPVAARQSWPRVAVCLAGAAAGLGFALWSLAALSGGPWNAKALADALVEAIGWLADPLLGGALLVAAFSLLFAFRLELRDKLIS
jgi:hypothetical protein